MFISNASIVVKHMQTRANAQDGASVEDSSSLFSPARLKAGGTLTRP